MACYFFQTQRCRRQECTDRHVLVCKRFLAQGWCDERNCGAAHMKLAQSQRRPPSPYQRRPGSGHGSPSQRRPGYRHGSPSQRRAVSPRRHSPVRPQKSQVEEYRPEAWQQRPPLRHHRRSPPHSPAYQPHSPTYAPTENTLSPQEMQSLGHLLDAFRYAPMPGPVSEVPRVGPSSSSDVQQVGPSAEVPRAGPSSSAEVPRTPKVPRAEPCELLTN